MDALRDNGRAVSRATHGRIPLWLAAACLAVGFAGSARAQQPVQVSPYPPAVAAITPAICPPAGSRVEENIGITLVYLGTVPGHPDLCREQRGQAVGDYYYGVWMTSWPGASEAKLALRRVIFGPPGTVARFDTIEGPSLKWHETLRNEGYEHLHVAGRYYNTMKIAHEREGFGGNLYHSIVTQWRDIRTGMTVYMNYQHISGWPEADAWSPTKITVGP